MSDSKHCHPLHHEGAARLGRLVQTLRPDAFQLDERTIQDLIVEAHRFAQTLKFFDETNTQAAGAYWENFWEVEILTYLAVLSAKDTDEIRRRFEELNDQFEQVKEAKPVPGAKRKQVTFETSYQPLLEYLRTLALSLEEAYQKLVRIKHPLQTLLLNRIRRDSCCDQEELEGVLLKLISYHKGADAGLEMAKYAGFFVPDQRWGIKDRVDYDAIAANPHFNQNDLRELFNMLFNTWLVLKNAAQAGFDEELARMELPEEVEYRIVQPHVVLFLVFLRLFRYAQESLNELGAKHLDFYYEEILGLRRRGEVPDEVYLLFELAKDFDAHLLEKGTLFSAGKDKDGQPLLFETIEDWVLRPAQVADIKTTWIDAQCGDIHANPDVKKGYLDGKEKPNENAQYWRSMGDDRHLPDGEVGFAIASPQLILREGKRVIDITLKLLNNIAVPGNLKSEYFKVFLSSTEEWIKPEFNPEVESEEIIPELTRGAFGMKFEPSVIRIRVILERDDLPVDSLGEELAEKAGFDTKWPIIKVIINPEPEKSCPTDPVQNMTASAVYEVLRTLVIGEIIVKVDVKGIRENLIIQTDQGVFNGTEKVFPFGPAPEVGHLFYIGSTEVFQKALTELKVNILWIGAPNNFVEHYQIYSDLKPKVQIDFIDKAEAKESDQEGKVEFDAANIDPANSKMKVFGKVINLEPSSTNPIKVKVNNSSDIDFYPTSGVYSVELDDVSFGSFININSGAINFQMGKSNRFKAYLIPKGTVASVDKIPVNTKAEIVVTDNKGNPVAGLSIQLNRVDVDPDDDGKYFVNISDLHSKDLKVKAESFQDVIFHHGDYDFSNQEFKNYSLINVKLYSGVASALPAAPLPAAGFISGKVVARNASPIQNAKVTAYKSGQLVGPVQTDDKGIFKLPVPVGNDEWIIQAFKDGTRSSKLTSVKENQSHTIQISDEIKVSDPFRGRLKGGVNSIETGNLVYGAQIRDANSNTLGETNENGLFDVDQAPLHFFNIINEAYTDLWPISIEDNTEYAITLVPKPAFIEFSGKVVPFFNPNTGLSGVDVRVVGTAIKTKTDQSGTFTIAVPTDLADFDALSFSKSGFKTYDVYVNSQSPHFSFIKVVLPEANPVELLVTYAAKRIIRDQFEVAINPLNVKRDPRTQFFERYSPTLKRGFLRFGLENTDFLHSQYPKILVKQTLLLGDDPETQIPNPPYTPATNYISLDYSSSQVITGFNNKSIDQFFHLLPFNGHKWIPLEAVAPKSEPEVQLLYPYMPDDTLPVTVKKLNDNGQEQIIIRPYAPGNLFIGISNLTPGGALSLLFQIEEGTEPQPEAPAPAIHWSYLAADNNWLSFKTGEIIRDNTKGLTRSGLIQFAIPTTAVKENTLLNPEYYWLRAAAKQADTDAGEAATNVQALPSMTNIRAQVVQARFKNQNNDLTHLAQPLPAETISKLLESRTAVKKVEQPLESFGGKLPESAGLDFYYRVSERLRHKDRAVTVWDYERLLLEHYPLVAAAKCIQHTRYKPADKASELAPGYVTVAVIPDLKKRKGEPWPEPRFTLGDLDEMRKFLAARANLCVAYGEDTEAQLQVVNPLYEKVDVLVQVAFKPGVDEAFYKEQLHKEIKHYISPWLADPAKAPSFGRTLERSAVLLFIEERPYVDYVVVEDYHFLIRIQETDIAGRPLVFQVTEQQSPTSTSVVTTVKSRIVQGKVCPGTARSILVAGNIVVGSTKDNDLKLPPMPAKVTPPSSTTNPPDNGDAQKSKPSTTSVSVPVTDVEKTDTATSDGGGTPVKPSKPGGAVKASKTTRRNKK